MERISLPPEIIVESNLSISAMDKTESFGLHQSLSALWIKIANPLKSSLLDISGLLSLALLNTTILSGSNQTSVQSMMPKVLRKHLMKLSGLNV